MNIQNRKADPEVPLKSQGDEATLSTNVRQSVC